MFRDHAPGLHRLIRSRIGDAGSVDDVLQETFVRFFRFYVVPGRLDPSRPVGPLLAMIATHEAARRGRALARQRRTDAAAWPIAVSDTVGSDEHIAALDEEPILRAALETLAPRQRRLLLQWETRRSTESLALAERVSVPVLKQVVTRARRNFRERYRQAGGVAVGIPVVLRLRTRLRFDSSRYDALATGVGLAVCSVVAVVVVSVVGGPVQGRTTEVASSDEVAVPAPASIEPTAATTALDVDAPPFELQPSHSTDTSAPAPAPTTGVRLAGNGADVGITSSRPGGETRSFNSFTVQCEAGTTGRVTCTALDLVPPALSGGGDP